MFHIKFNTVILLMTECLLSIITIHQHCSTHLDCHLFTRCSVVRILSSRGLRPIYSAQGRCRVYSEVPTVKFSNQSHFEFAKVRQL